MIASELVEKIVSLSLTNGSSHTPVCLEIMESTSDGLELEEAYYDIESVELITTPSGRRVIALRT